jgi:hypothetical protein
MRKKGVLYNYLISNKKDFFIIIGVFFIGMILGIFMINCTSESKLIEVNSYINSICENLKSADGINKTECLIKSIVQNIIFIIVMWILRLHNNREFISICLLNI